jgi:Holliday junction DNA helicase RuvA
MRIPQAHTRRAEKTAIRKVIRAYELSALECSSEYWNKPFRENRTSRVDTTVSLFNNRSMIGQLRGKLIERRPNQVIVDVGGVGYLVQIPLSTFSSIGALHSEVTLLTHTHLREDQLTLFGFLTAKEKDCFELLISVSGIGPSLALKVLSGIRVEELIPAIRNSDHAQLVRIPGIGRKTAERIVVELREKVAALEPGEAGKPATHSPLEADVASALVNLGYDVRAVERVLEQLRSAPGSPADFNAMLRAALQQLGGAAMQKNARAAAGDSAN